MFATLPPMNEHDLRHDFLGLRRVWIAIVLAAHFLMLTTCGTPLRASDPLDWDVMAIFFPADQQRQVVPNNYVPINFDDLQVKLGAESERRQAALLNSPELVEAVYVAQLDKGQIVSDRSLWRFTGTPSNTLFSLGQVSCALRDARGIPAEYEQLSKDLRFNADGSLELVYLSGTTERWFGFASVAQLESDGKLFDLRLPAATLARMLIATPRQYDLRSDDVAIQPIADPAEYFPTQWPTENGRLIDAGARWWLINLSGKSQMRLEVKTIVAEESMWNKHTLSSAETTYRVGAESIDLTAKFDFAASSNASPVRLRFSDGLRIKDVNVDGIPVRWRSSASLAGDSDLIEITQANISSDSVIEVTASGDLQSGQNVLLPEVAVAESFAIAGSSRVLTAEGIKTNRLEAEGMPLSLRTFVEAVDPSSAALQLTGVVDWMGVQPRINARFSQQTIPWQTNGLTRFTVQTASISASTRMKLSAQSVDSNEVRLAVSSDWFVDEVKLINDAGGDLRAKFLEVGTNGQRRTEVVISWESQQSSVEFELEINAHSPRTTDLNKVELQLSKLLSLDGAVQQDTFVIESGRYQLQLNQELLRFQKQPGELPDWQRALLPQLTDIWILQAANRKVPPVTFLASTGTFSSKTKTIVKTSDELVSLDYHIRCEPISGTLDRVKILFPSSVDASQLNFTLTLSIDGKVIPLNSSDIVLHRDPTSVNAIEQEIDVILPTPTQRAFEIRSSLNVKREKLADPIDIVVPGIPRATKAESIVILPKSMAQFRGRNAIELLPIQACCSDDELTSLAESLPTSLLVAARVDASESSTLRLRPANALEPRGWAWSESVDMRLWDDGSRSYRVQWDVEVGDFAEVQINLPDRWELEHAFVDGLLVSVARNADSSMSIAAPPNKRSMLEIECSRKFSQESWLASYTFSLEHERPKVSLPVLIAKQQLRIPPSKIAVDSLGVTRRPSKIADRLLPNAWWQLLPPNAFVPSTASADEAGWSRLELPLDRSDSHGFDSRLWIVDRSTLSATIFSGLLICAAVFWLALGKTAQRWWVTISLIVVAVVLVPVAWLPLAQLLLLSVLLAGFARMVQVILQSKNATRVTTASRSGRGPQDLPISLLLLTIANAAAFSNTAFSQEAIPSVQATTGTKVETQSNQTSIYGVLLPLDEEGKLSGSYVHIPSELDKMLSQSNTNSLAAGPPKVVSAEYVFTTRASSMNQQEIVQSFSADFRIEVTQLQTPIRLSFDAKQLELVYGEVKEREVLVGLSALKQESDAVVFKPTELGVQSVRLRFESNPDSTNGAASRFSTMIPPIANATLRINSSSNTKFVVNAIGGTERISTSESLSHLGPIAVLDISWTDNNRLNGFPAPIEVSSETWLHASRGQLMAACQLRSANPGQPLPQVLSVNIDSNWEPVGTDWGDAKLTFVDTPAFVNRRVYTTKFPTLSEKELSQKESPQVLRVLLVPKNLDKLTLPFLSVQGVASTRRLLAFSTTEVDAWKPDGIETWPELFRDLPSWGPLDFAQPKRVFRVPTTYSQLLLRRQANRPSPIVNELTDVHLKAENIDVDYRATWESPTSPDSVLQLRIPLDAKISAALINGVDTAFRVSERAEYAQLIFPIPGRQERLVEVRVTLTLPQTFGSEHTLPRVVMERVTARRSQFRLFRAENIDCEILANETGATWTPMEVNEAMQLDALELPVGEIELGSAYRELASLPLNTRCRESIPAACSVALQKLVRGPDGWTVVVSAEWEADAKLDFVYFDLPIGIRDMVSSSFARKFLPSADPSRTILSLVPAITPTSKRVEFAFPLTGVSTQSLSIPRVHLLSQARSLPAIVLPTKIEGQEVAWKKVGRRLGSAWHVQAGLPVSEEYHYFAHDERQTQVNWVPVGTDKVQARVENTNVEITSISPTEISGIVSYWIAPRGQLALQLNLPPSSELLGVELGNETAIWLREANGQVSVTMQPNYLPVHLRLPLRWKLDAGAEHFQIELPDVVAEQTSNDILVSFGGSAEVQNEIAWTIGGSEMLAGYDAILLDRWGTLVANTLQAQKGVLPSEIEAWMLTWEPPCLGIQPQTTISPTLEGLLDRELLNNDENRLSVGEFWERLGLQYNLQLRPVATAKRAGIGGTSARARACYVRRGEALRFIPIPEINNTGSRWLAAAMLAIASFLIIAVAYRLRSSYFAVLSNHPWLYWVQLAVVGWLLLPAIWPSCILTLTAVCMLISQVLDTRQRNRTFRRV